MWVFASLFLSSKIFLKLIKFNLHFCYIYSFFFFKNLFILERQCMRVGRG